MRYFVVFIALLWHRPVHSQDHFFDLLAGNWKVEGRNLYEHWDRIDSNQWKGFSYMLRKDGSPKISEYTTINRSDRHTLLKATVLGQNQGQEVEFVLHVVDSQFQFRNEQHDFPKKIAYRPLSDTVMEVHVGNPGKAFSYKMYKYREQQAAKDSTTDNPEYDEALARQMQADDYGMKRYFLVILETGNNDTSDQAFITEQFRGHMENIDRMVTEKKLVLAGPLGKNTEQYRGIFILDQVQSLDQARTLLQSDPAIRSGLLDCHIYNWYGSAALPVYLEFSEKIWKKKP